MNFSGDGVVLSVMIVGLSKTQLADTTKSHIVEIVSWVLKTNNRQRHHDAATTKIHIVEAFSWVMQIYHRH